MQVLFIAFCLFLTMFAARPASAEFEAAKVIARTPIVSDDTAPNLIQGTTSIGTGIGLDYSSYSSLIVDLYPTVEYFVLDRFSMGGSMQATLSRYHEHLAFGPSATFYFWEQQNWASHLGGSFLFSHEVTQPEGRITDRWAVNGRLGLNHFFEPSVSFGPEFTLTSFLGDGAEPDRVEGALLFKLSMFM